MALALIRVKQIKTHQGHGERAKNLHGLNLTRSFNERAIFDPQKNLCNAAVAVLSNARDAIELANAK